MSAVDSTEWPVFPASFHTGLVTRRFFESWAFYTERLGFRTADEGGDWVRLVHPSGGQLLLLQQETNAPVAELVSAVEPRGVWLTLDVPEPAMLAGELRDAGCEVEAIRENAGWGRGLWSLSDPDGVRIFLRRRETGVGRSQHGEKILTA